ncbi:hypothetical protein ACOME3_003237 [Neoechinorhynchus agilis]
MKECFHVLRSAFKISWNLPIFANRTTFPRPEENAFHGTRATRKGPGSMATAPEQKKFLKYRELQFSTLPPLNRRLTMLESVMGLSQRASCGSFLQPPILKIKRANATNVRE